MKETVSITGFTLAVSIVTYYRQNTLEIVNIYSVHYGKKW